MTSKVGFEFGSGINNSGSTTFFVAQEYLKGHCHKSHDLASCQSDTDKKLEFILNFDCNLQRYSRVYRCQRHRRRRRHSIFVSRNNKHTYNFMWTQVNGQLALSLSYQSMARIEQSYEVSRRSKLNTSSSLLFIFIFH